MTSSRALTAAAAAAALAWLPQIRRPDQHHPPCLPLRRRVLKSLPASGCQGRSSCHASPAPPLWRLHCRHRQRRRQQRRPRCRQDRRGGVRAAQKRAVARPIPRVVGRAALPSGGRRPTSRHARPGRRRCRCRPTGRSERVSRPLCRRPLPPQIKPADVRLKLGTIPGSIGALPTLRGGRAAGAVDLSPGTGFSDNAEENPCKSVF